MQAVDNLGHRSCHRPGRIARNPNLGSADMLYLRQKRSLDLGEPIDESDVHFLRQQLEIGVDGMMAFYLDRRTIDSWAIAQASPALIGRLRAILDLRDDAEVEVLEGNAGGGVAPIAFGESSVWERATLHIPLVNAIPEGFTEPSETEFDRIEPASERPVERSMERQLNCVVCGTQIYQHERVRARVTIDVGDSGAEVAPECFVCSACGYMHWFMPSRSTETPS